MDTEIEVLKIDKSVRRLIKAAIDRCGKTRHEIASEMSTTLGIAVTKAMIDGWSSEEKVRLRFPLCFLESFSEATGDDGLQRFAAGSRLRRALIVGEGELAKLELRRKPRGKKRRA